MPEGNPNQTAQYSMNASFCTFNSAGEVVGICAFLNMQGGEIYGKRKY